MKPFLIAALFVFPVGISAQTYSDSLFAKGADPNNVQPITAAQKFQIRFMRGIGPRALLFDAFSAGINQWKNDPGSWGRGGEAYAQRFGSESGRDNVREMLAFGLDATLHTDPRVYRSTHTHFAGRLLDALSQVIITRTDSGGRAPAIANVTSAFAAGQIQTIWMPPNDAHVKDGLVSGGFILLGDAGRDVAREFWPDIRRKFHHGG